MLQVESNKAKGKSRNRWRLPYSFCLLPFAFLLLTPSVGATPPEKTAVPALQSLTIEPGQIRLRGSNRQQQLLITGKTPAGTLVDVTHLCDLVSSDPAIVTMAGSRVQG